jgi:hypothetical protein
MKAGAACVKVCAMVGVYKAFATQCCGRENPQAVEIKDANTSRRLPCPSASKRVQHAVHLSASCDCLVFLSVCATRRLCAALSHVSEFIWRNVWRTYCTLLPRAKMTRSTPDDGAKTRQLIVPSMSFSLCKANAATRTAAASLFTLQALDNAAREQP